MPTPQESTEWLAARLRTHNNIAFVKLLGPQLIWAERKEFPAFQAGVLSLKLVEKSHFEQFVEKTPVDYIVNIPKAGIWHPLAVDYLRINRISSGGMAAFYSEIKNSEILTEQLPRELRFLESLLNSHRKVIDFHPINARVYHVDRSHGLPAVKVTGIESYEITAEAVLRTLERSQGFEIAMTGPLDSLTSDAQEIAEANGIEFYKPGEFLVRLNR